jgi:hypothetical protein
LVKQFVHYAMTDLPQKLDFTPEDATRKDTTNAAA